MWITIPPLLFIIAFLITYIFKTTKKHIFWSLLTFFITALTSIGLLWFTRSPQPWETSLLYTKILDDQDVFFYLLGDYPSWLFVFTFCLTGLASLLQSSSLNTFSGAEAKHETVLSSLFYISLAGIVSISGNILTLILAWCVLDILSLKRYIKRTIRPLPLWESVRLGMKLASTMLLVWIMVSNSQASISLTFSLQNSIQSWSLIAGFVLRILSLYTPIINSNTSQFPLDTWSLALSKLVEFSALWILSIRISPLLDNVLGPQIWMNGMTILGLFSAIRWWKSKIPSSSIQHLMASFTFLSLYNAAFSGLVPLATWTVGVIILTAQVFWQISIRRWLIVWNILPVLLFSIINLNTSWSSTNIDGVLFSTHQLLWSFSISFLLAGLFKHSLYPRKSANFSERWMELSYFSGGTLFLIGLIIPFYWRYFILEPLSLEILSINNLWPSLLVIIITPVLTFISQRKTIPHFVNFQTITEQAQNLLFRVSDLIVVVIESTANIFENKAGWLWSGLVLLLVISIIFVRN